MTGSHTEARTRVALAVFAHPDDETLLAGALIPKLIHDGWQVHLLCIAPGDDDDLAARMELAAAELGIETVNSLRYAPAGSGATGETTPPALMSAPEPVVISQIAGKIAGLAPGMIVTHSPAGDYGHPDHAFCHRVTVAAAREAAPSAAVYALAWPRSALWLNSFAGMLLSRFGRRVPGIGSEGAGAGKVTTARRLRVTETHRVGRFLRIRKRAARHYRKELALGPLPLRMLEAAPTWLQWLALGKARLSRVR